MSAATVTYANDGLDIKGTYGYLDQTGKASPCLRWSKELNPRQAQIRVATLAKKLESHACLHVLWRTHPLCDTMLTLAFVKTAQPQDGDNPPWTDAIGEPKASFGHVKGNPALLERGVDDEALAHYKSIALRQCVNLGYAIRTRPGGFYRTTPAGCHAIQTFPDAYAKLLSGVDL